MIPQDKLDEISNRLDIVALVSEYVPLKKTGRYYKGLCPFHAEKTPSFIVTPEKRIFHCFGCAEGGNLFGFLMKMENLSFPEAVKKLADRTGVVLPAFDKKDKKAREEQDSREVLYKVNRYAAWYFADCLKKPGGAAVRDYLKKRGLSLQTVEEFRLGFAPDSWEGLAHFLKSKNVPQNYAEILGLTRKRKDGSPYDFFRNRLMFPIIDFEGRIIGFGGRRVGDPRVSDPGAPADEAKYINSPESPIYHKGLSVYGLAQAKKAIRETGEVILVEGYMDLIRLHQAGIQNCVAPLGTALTLSQINTLRRSAEKFTLMFDGDTAGKKAAERALWLLFEAGFHPRLVSLPDGEDPDSFIQRHGGEKLRRVISGAGPAMEELLSEGLQNSGLKVSDRVESAKRLLPFIEALPSELEKKGYLSRVSQFLGTDEVSLKSLKARQKGEAHTLTPGRIPERKISLERILLELYVRDPCAVAGVLNRELFQQFEDENLKMLALTVEENFSRLRSAGLERFLNGGSGFEPALVSELAVASELWPEGEDLKKAAADCLNRWKLEKLKGELKKITREVQMAELRENKDQIFELLVRKDELAKGIRQLQQNN